MGWGLKNATPSPLGSVHATLTKTPPNNPKIRRSLPKVEKSMKAGNLPSEPLQHGLEGGADSRIRTDDQRFTKPLLYH
jgi:hypothetical protein